MYNVLIVGAGSIGNHLAHACRCKGWEVTMFDIDPAALQRTQSEIYPSRYGEWDQAIRLIDSLEFDQAFDLIIIGTPPDIHLDNVLNVLKVCPPKVLLIEKPLVSPIKANVDMLRELSLQPGPIILAGYNHNMSKITIRAEQLLGDDLVGDPLSLHVRWLEHWGGIFQAHPWLEGPQDSYLGFWSRGGGACAEHSHAISLWQHFSQALNCGPISEVSATMDMRRSEFVNYDQTTVIGMRSKRGLTGSIVQDVVTSPAQKMMRIQGVKGFLEWYVNYDDGHDALIYGRQGEEINKEQYSKKRPDDFIGEIDHIETLLKSDCKNSPLSLDRAINVMDAIIAAHESHQRGKMISI